jgi:hypothetical protein
MKRRKREDGEGETEYQDEYKDEEGNSRRERSSRIQGG